jgi:hypothetical protein
VKTIIEEYQAHKQKQQKEQESRKNQQKELERLMQQIEDMQNSMKIDSLVNVSEANPYENQFVYNRKSYDSDLDDIKGNVNEFNPDCSFQGDEESFRSDGGFKLEDCQEEFKEEYDLEYEGKGYDEKHRQKNQEFDENFKNMDPSSGEIYESSQKERIKCENSIDNSSGYDKNYTNISSLYELLQEQQQETQCTNDSASGDYQELIRQQQQIYEELKYKSIESKSTVDDFVMTEEFIQEQQRMYEELTSNQHHPSTDTSSSQTRNNSSYSRITSDIYEAPSSSSTSKTLKATTSKTKKSSKNAPVLSDIVPENEVIIREIYMI